MVNVVIYLLILWIGVSLGQTDGNCDVKFTKIGCFKDDQNLPRPLPTILFNDREGSSGNTIDWEHWDNYVDDVTCRCAKETIKHKYGYFSLQFYGECWSGRDSGASFPRAGKSLHCVTKGFDKCVEKSKINCVGESLANFVYIISAHESQCHIKYKKDGCYNNNHAEPHAFPILLFTDNIPDSPKYSNVSSDFTNWNSYIMDLACRCAAKSRLLNYKRFTLQSYGECWSGPEFEPAVPVSEDKDNTCIGKAFGVCAKDDVVCVGQKKSNYVYKIIL